MKHLTTISLITFFIIAVLIIISFCCAAFGNYHLIHATAIKGEEGAVFWAKFFFSATFCLSALYIILSERYDDETKKWAFSVLTLIAGVWIGTVTS